MKLLKLHPNIIREFEREDIVNLSENGGFLYWLTDEQKTFVEEFEETNNAPFCMFRTMKKNGNATAKSLQTVMPALTSKT